MENVSLLHERCGPNGHEVNWRIYGRYHPVQSEDLAALLERINQTPARQEALYSALKNELPNCLVMEKPRRIFVGVDSERLSQLIRRALDPEEILEGGNIAGRHRCRVDQTTL